MAPGGSCRDVARCASEQPGPIEMPPPGTRNKPADRTRQAANPATTRQSCRATLMQVTESLGDCLRVAASMLDIVTDRFSVDADIDNDIVSYDAVFHGFARPQLYV